MDRRRFLVMSLAGALATALISEAQRPEKLPKLGYLSNSSSESAVDTAFMQALRDLGWVGGQTIVIEARYTAGALFQASDVLRYFRTPLTRTPSRTYDLQRRQRARLGLDVELLNVSAPEELVRAYAEIHHRRADAPLVLHDIMFWARRAEIVGLAAKGRVPAPRPSASLSPVAARAGGSRDRVNHPPYLLPGVTLGSHDEPWHMRLVRVVSRDVIAP
jgi:hypothetical protein